MADKGKSVADLGDPADKESAKPAKAGAEAVPDWTDGLKRLYDSVVEEPLPDELTKLLAQFDDDGDDDDAAGKGE